MQIVNLRVFKITSKHEGGATPAALQIKHCAGASFLILVEFMIKSNALCPRSSAVPVVPLGLSLEKGLTSA